MTTAPEDLAGVLEGVVASWYRGTGRTCVPYPIHVWLTIEGLGTRKLHTAGDGAIAILDEPVHEAYDMEVGTVGVESGTPSVLAAEVGQRIRATSLLWQEPSGEVVGFILHFEDSNDIGIANLADDLEIRTWPEDAWSRAGVTVVHRNP
jgi:hypothetical protein